MQQDGSKYLPTDTPLRSKYFFLKVVMLHNKLKGIERGEL